MLLQQDEQDEQDGQPAIQEDDSGVVRGTAFTLVHTHTHTHTLTHSLTLSSPSPSLSLSPPLQMSVPIPVLVIKKRPLDDPVSTGGPPFHLCAHSLTFVSLTPAG